MDFCTQLHTLTHLLGSIQQDRMCDGTTTVRQDFARRPGRRGRITTVRQRKRRGEAGQASRHGGKRAHAARVAEDPSRILPPRARGPQSTCALAPPGRRPRRCRPTPGTPLPKHRSGAHAGRPANRPGLMMHGTSHGQEHGRGNKMDMLTALRWRAALVEEKLRNLGRTGGRRQGEARPQSGPKFSRG